MKILLLTPEHPSQDTQGRGSPVGRDVEALACAYRDMGHEVRVAVPRYGTGGQETHWNPVQRVRVSFLQAEETQIFAGTQQWAHVRMIGHPLFERSHPYLDDSGYDHPDNALRFAIFGASALIDCAVEEWRPDLVHGHEWQSGLGILYATHHLADLLGHPRRLFTFQDAAYQGLADISWAPAIGLGPEWVVPDRLEFWGRLNLLKAGLVYSDRATSPSRHYLDALLADHHGYGLEGLFRALGKRVQPAPPGIDPKFWTVPASVRNNPSALMAWKAQHRLQTVPGKEPLVVFASAFRPGKGIDHILTLLPDLLKMDLRIGIVGGQGTEERRHLEQVAAMHPERIHLFPKGDDVVFSVLAGADLLLLPVAHQPGGILYARAMAVGTPVLAHRVGAAADRIQPWPKALSDGFLFDDLAPDTLLRHLRKALQLRSNAPEWAALCARAAARDFSWSQTAQNYLQQIACESAN